MVRQHRLAGGPAAFTLIELLAVIVVIGILAGLMFGALTSAAQRAKITKTKTTIAKLNRIIMRQYESYFTRRLPTTYIATYPAGPAARDRVNALRDLMRMEMPDRWGDVATFTGADPSGPATPLVLPTCPSLSYRYYRLLKEAWDAADTQDKKDKVLDFASAECLYMIVMSDPENAEQFQASEMGDFDRDGLPEFEDAWGHPIRFVRWPAGFIEYATLKTLSGDNLAGAVGGASLSWSSPSDVQSGDRTVQPDPFDARGILAAQGGYALFPLIYSAGPDGIYDINVGKSGSGSYSYSLDASSINPYLHDGNTADADEAGHTFRYVGQPLDGDNKAIDGSTTPNGVLDHYDNIHNQRIDTKL